MRLLGQLMDALSSKKFVATLGGVGSLQFMDIPSDKAGLGAVVLIAAYVLAQGIADGLSKKYARVLPKDKR